MKNYQRGSVTPLLVVIIAVLVIGGGWYIYSMKKAATPAAVDTGTQQPSPAASTVEPSVTVVSPNGGESFKKGDTPLVRWSSKNIGTDTLEIDLLKNDGTLVYNLSSLVNPSQGNQFDSNGPSYAWSIPTDDSPGGRRISAGQYKIRIGLTHNSSVVDASNSYFTVSEK